MILLPNTGSGYGPEVGFELTFGPRRPQAEIIPRTEALIGPLNHRPQALLARTPTHLIGCSPTAEGGLWLRSQSRWRKVT